MIFEQVDIQAASLARFAYLNRILPCLLAAIVSFLVLTRAPHLITMLFPNLSRLLDNVLVDNSSGIVLLYRIHANNLQAIVTHMLDENQLVSLQLATKPLHLKDKLILVLGACDVSVIIPTLNEEKYLPSCLKSLVNQSFKGDYEVIVVDGGSVDRTNDIAGCYTQKVISAKGRPVGAARNEGAKHAKGDIVAFMDADTIACESWLTAVRDSFDSESVLGVTGPTLPSDGTFSDEVTYRLWTIYLQRVLLLVGMPHVIGFNCAYRRKPFLQVGGFDETNVTSEDIRLAIKIRKIGRIVFQKRMFALTSARRFHRYGHVKLVGLYLINGVSTLLANRSCKNYPPVR